MCLLLIAALLTAPPAAAEAGPAGVGSRTAYLTDAASGGTRWARGADTAYPAASITKVMTALVVLRAGGLDRVVTIEQKHVDYAVRHGATSAGLRAGERLTARELLYALLLPSGADAAYALAEAYAPTWQDFVAEMNATAASLGMTRTRYDNVDGLPYPTRDADPSTPRDLVRLGRAALRYAAFRRTVRTRVRTLPGRGAHRAHTWTNTNRLLGAYRGATGIKTGYTGAAGYCLLFTARRGRRTLIGATLGGATSAGRFADAARLLDWGFGVTSPSRLRTTESRD
ncbi:D-alanyl-D-alanine carboxypeptidase [Actinomadura sp. RB68]|uniref:D-alanyl-D-alanine carboxypeptidase n=1 Tax=Actinomadura macrotermitis TaxID=2585200 RepID=A0A7K0BNW0_9ACTN|nr:D-alanyl-D-alanine carboxypeptidase [Actinomadura macrotermitis]